MVRYDSDLKPEIPLSGVFFGCFRVKKEGVFILYGEKSEGSL